MTFHRRYATQRKHTYAAIFWMKWLRKCEGHKVQSNAKYVFQEAPISVSHGKMAIL
jgi:hypothetical protein